MMKIKEKLIHMLGGLTEEDVMIRTRPQRVAVSRFSIRTLRVCQIVRPDMLDGCPDYMEHVRKDMAYQIGDKMTEECLIEFSSKEETPDMIRVSALARIVIPTEVSE
jgi:hypothetical protein